MRICLLFILFCELLPAGARGAFECLPGPAAGGQTNWAWGTGDEAARARASFAIGRPATVEGLAWSHAQVRVGALDWKLSGEVYLLALEDLYRESVAGIWAGRGRLYLGVRFWRVGWADGTARSGGTLGVDARPRIRKIRLRVVAQDIAIGRRDVAAPPSCVSISARIRAAQTLDLEIGARRSRGGTLALGGVSWTPLPPFSLYQNLRIPGEIVQSGIECAAPNAAFALWVEPSARLGPRIGLKCSLR